jgi:hypothetical protein
MGKDTSWTEGHKSWVLNGGQEPLETGESRKEHWVDKQEVKPTAVQQGQEAQGLRISVHKPGRTHATMGTV